MKDHLIKLKDLLQLNKNTIDKEAKEYRHDIGFYQMFGNNANTILNNLKDLVDRCKKQGTPVVGYGAAAKGMTVLNAKNIQLD